MPQQYRFISRYEDFTAEKKDDTKRIVHGTKYFTSFEKAFAELINIDNRSFLRETAEAIPLNQICTSVAILNKKGDFIIGKRLMHGVPDVLEDGVYLTVDWEHPEWKKHAGQLDLSWATTKPYSKEQNKYLLETARDIMDRALKPVERNTKKPSIQRGHTGGPKQKR